VVIEPEAPMEKQIPTVMFQLLKRGLVLGTSLYLPPPSQACFNSQKGLVVIGTHMPAADNAASKFQLPKRISGTGNLERFADSLIFSVCFNPKRD